MYSVYIFDFDYTLGDATNGIVLSVNYALEQMGFIAFSKEEIRKTVGMQLADTYTHLTKDNNKINQTRFIALFKQKADIVMLDNTELFHDTKYILRQLKENNIKTAIVTTKYHYRIADILKKFCITDLVDVIVGGDDVNNPKPHSEPIEKALKLLDVSKKECVFIGDSLIDAETAFNAKVDFIGVTTGTAYKNEFGKFPHIKILSGLSELLTFKK